MANTKKTNTVAEVQPEYDEVHTKFEAYTGVEPYLFVSHVFNMIF